ncbi:MAG TPA: ROK family protein [Chloroflexi bacterium]|jgi:glucokinase|nr:ROK family protein [Chloroflexota bacterium]
MNVYLAVDIGGTHMRAAVFPADGSIVPLAQKRIHTASIDHTPADRLIRLLEELWPVGDSVLGIGAVAPGYIDDRLGVIYDAPNIPGWVNFPLRDLLQERFHVPVVVGNDANLAALGEWRFGAGVGHSNLLYLTISTGIGGGVIIDNHLLTGSRGLAAELGHVTVLPGGPLCGCGHRGHLEALASGPAIARFVADELAKGLPSTLLESSRPTAQEIGLAAQRGDTLAQAAFTRAGTFIGYALADFLHIFNPSIVIFGGGVSQAGSLLLDPIRTGLEQRIMSPEYTENLIITTAALDDNAGLVGALALAATTLGQEPC